MIILPEKYGFEEISVPDFNYLELSNGFEVEILEGDLKNLRIKISDFRYDEETGKNLTFNFECLEADEKLTAKAEKVSQDIVKMILYNMLEKECGNDQSSSY